MIDAGRQPHDTGGGGGGWALLLCAGESKLMAVLHAAELNKKRCAEAKQPVIAVSLHPGPLRAPAQLIAQQLADGPPPPAARTDHGIARRPPLEPPRVQTYVLYLVSL